MINKLKKIKCYKLEELFSNFKYYLIMLIILIIIFILRKPLVSLLVVAGLIVIGSFSTIYKRFIPLSIGFELITFSTVLIAYAYGALAAVVSVILMTFFSHFLQGRLCVTMFIRMFVYSLVGLAAALLSGNEISFVGKVLTIGMNIIFFFIWVFGMGFNPVSATTSVILNSVINFIIFSKYAESVLGFLS